MHVLVQSFIEAGLVFVVFLEDDVGQFVAVVEKVFEGKYDMVFGSIDCVPSCYFILEVSVAISEALDESSELFLDFFSVVLLCFYPVIFNLHGAYL